MQEQLLRQQRHVVQHSVDSARQHSAQGLQAMFKTAGKPKAPSAHKHAQSAKDLEFQHAKQMQETQPVLQKKQQAARAEALHQDAEADVRGMFKTEGKDQKAKQEALPRKPT